jgi:16S rRNA (guanine(966)-N(2))-methyltransferase RsmD
MRVIGGESRGKTIRLPGGCRIRPTTDRVKGALFNILGSLEGKSFLDLYAGCGNVGLEALSRGAQRLVFVEKDRRLFETIRENLRLLGFEARAEVIAADAEEGVRRLRIRGERFDLLFADPPYEEGFPAKIVAYLGGAELLAENGAIILQHSRREPLKQPVNDALIVYDQRRYGDTLLSFLKNAERK